MRQFETGTTRDSDANKFDYEGFESPRVTHAFAAYMHKHRTQADGKIRDSDNWQKGIPKDAYMKSMWRHFFDVWCHHRGLPSLASESLAEALGALRFNLNGYWFETLKDEATPVVVSGLYIGVDPERCKSECRGDRCSQALGHRGSHKTAGHSWADCVDGHGESLL